MSLVINNLRVSTAHQEILHGVNLTIAAGEIVALMGPNGSGKSTLANVLMGHPGYEVIAGQVLYNGQDVLAMKPEERAAAGLFLSFQYPPEVAGVSVGSFLRLAYNSTHPQPIGVKDFVGLLKAKMQLLNMPLEFMTRSVNEGFSGGEKKRAEMLQLAVLEPKLAILDETDSGLDIDALKIVAACLQAVRQKNPALGVLLITHYQRILQYLPADRLVVLRAGTIVAEGNMELLATIEQRGYHSL